MHAKLRQKMMRMTKLRTKPTKSPMNMKKPAMMLLSL